MKINGNKLWVAGVLIVLMSMFSIGETQKPITENEIFGILGLFFMTIGICIDKE